MRRLTLAILIGSTALLVGPVTSHADHVSISAAVGARLAERSAPGSWTVLVSYGVVCNGAGARGASYSGDLYLIDMRTGREIYLGGVASASGNVRVRLRSSNRPDQYRPELRVTCFDNETLHGSERIAVTSRATLVVPERKPRADTRADGTGGGGGGGGGDPTQPAGSGGCKTVRLGTDGPDTIEGGGGPEVIFGFDGADAIRGAGGHDCVIGGRQNDRLFGDAGNDRLTGGSGRDRLVGGPGVNAYDAGPGRDFVHARNGRRELVRCGSGRDTARVDRRDRVRSCERVRRPR